MSRTGLLPLNKSAGIRSTACVETIRRSLGGKVKVGHGGTLDSTASGLLILLIGHATRLSSYIMSMPKRYDAVIQLGSETTTDDASGEIKSESDWKCVTETMVDNALPAFLGWRMQEPPQVSAVHVNGERAHRLAREGREVLIKPKPVNITRIQRLSAISAEGRVSLRIYCHMGTYIRSLARDLGRRIGCGAHVHALHRISSGPFSASSALYTETLAQLNPLELEKRILSVGSLYNVSTRYAVDEAGKKNIVNGCPQILSQLKRANFGRFINDFNQIVLTYNDIFSICQMKKKGNSIELSPKINIFYGGGDDR